MKVLAIETSCDETSIAILESVELESINNENLVSFLNNFKIKANIISSQIHKHQPYGGVIPEISAREHATNLQSVLLQCLFDATKTDVNQNKNTNFLDYLSNISLIAVTSTPGLASALKTGVEFAKSLAFMIKQKFNIVVPIVNVNHLHGHVLSSFYEVDKFQGNHQYDNLNPILPHLHLLVSGGNTQLFIIKDWHQWELIGQTLDDAIGESLDKIGRMLGLLYPAGVQIAKIAKLDTTNYCNFTIGMQGNTSFDFSYSGHKTAVRYYLQKNSYQLEKNLSQQEVQTLVQCVDHKNLNSKLSLVYKVCVSAQYVAIKQLENRLKQAIDLYQINSLGISGGVSANLLLRKIVKQLDQQYLQNKPIVNQNYSDSEQKNFVKTLFIPDISLTGDNAVMIALAGIFKNYFVKTKM